MRELFYLLFAIVLLTFVLYYPPIYAYLSTLAWWHQVLVCASAGILVGRSVEKLAA